MIPTDLDQDHEFEFNPKGTVCLGCLAARGKLAAHVQGVFTVSISSNVVHKFNRWARQSFPETERERRYEDWIAAAGAFLKIGGNLEELLW